MAVGNRVFLKRPMPSQELLDGFAGLPAANIADTMGRSCAMNPRIKLMSGFQGIMVGPALTVKARAGDNLFLHQLCYFSFVMLIESDIDPVFDGRDHVYLCQVPA